LPGLVRNEINKSVQEISGQKTRKQVMLAELHFAASVRSATLA
jgi:hypothetical protein